MLTLGVAFTGVLSALMALQLERSREHAILRATGMTGGQIVALVLTQTSIIGVTAGFAAMPLGIGTGIMLIDVINPRSFGWTIPLRIDWDTVLTGALLALGAAILAGIYPALRAANADPSAALHDE